ncbi:uncharacterized protein LOC123316241 isoform X3 [Coccinella septempunctata]|uniref:uncharacterized protein LOC123316241 isoform X3 n=1 Tax=Coccinella septempunctata TaxID=41139 RepID=UPI001D06A6B0|nr:uncharacterized protein LOC123316241 isoform X3 [Coccinella septempunctata]
MKVLYFLLIFLLAYAAATQALPSHQTSDGADMDGTVESVDEVRAKRGFDDRESSSLRDKREIEGSVYFRQWLSTKTLIGGIRFACSLLMRCLAGVSFPGERFLPGGSFNSFAGSMKIRISEFQKIIF